MLSAERSVNGREAYRRRVTAKCKGFLRAFQQVNVVAAFPNGNVARSA